MENKTQDKEQLRKILLEKQKLISETEIKKRSLELCEKVSSSLIFENAKIISCYLSFGKEIDTMDIINNCFMSKKTLCVPVVIGNDMIFSKIDSTKNLVKNKMGFLEPENIVEIPKHKIDLIIVPALGYNENKYRLGYGRGFYDRYLKDFKNMTLGMCFKEFIVDFTPSDYDIPVKKLFIG